MLYTYTYTYVCMYMYMHMHMHMHIYIYIYIYIYIFYDFFFLIAQSDDFRQQCIKKSDVVQDVVGSGPHRKIVLTPQTDKQCGTE